MLARKAAIAMSGVDEGVFGIESEFNQKNLFLPSGNYTLVFVPLSYISADYKGKATISYFNLAMPAAAKTQALVAKNGFVVTGKATDAGGKAVAAIIMASNNKALLDLDFLSLNIMIAVPDKNGNYRFALPADTFNIQAIPLSGLSSVSPGALLRRLTKGAAIKYPGL